MDMTKKQYKHVLVAVDAFSNWLYPTKSTGADEVVDIMKRQSDVFGNPSRIIMDRGTAFTANAFQEYCKVNHIQHLLVATGVPRGNGKVERINKIVITILTKLCAEDPKTWYKHVGWVQQFINSSPPRSTKIAPFKIRTGINMKTKYDKELVKLLEEDFLNELQEEME
ncbi:uncharacterized protein [Drosophila suzukii]|uniref:Integrase catalytic domain-containing protein n=1 Tax=Drosophila suzukii TaxID=28584 RepID=A0ABM4TXZ6_DROSZ